MSKRFKGNMWGPEGSGKTRIGMGMPKPIILDSEKGTEWYADEFPDAVVEHITTFDDTCERVREIIQRPGDRLSIVIDSVTMIHKDLILKWTDLFETRNQKSEGFKIDYYELQPKDYRLINADWDRLIRELSRVDMNVLLLSRETDAYAKGSFMKAIGVKPDCYKGIPYFVDVNLRLTRDPSGKFLAKVDGGDNLESGSRLKDRTNCFPVGKSFPFDSKILTQMFGADNMTRTAIGIKLATPEQCVELQTLFDAMFITPDKVKRDLAKYEASEIKDLTEDQAATIIEKLNESLQKRKAQENATL